MGRKADAQSIDSDARDPDHYRNKAKGRKADARTFGQDLMRGEHEVGEGRQADARSFTGGATDPGSLGRRYAQDGEDAKTNGGVLMPSHTSGDPSFYKQKREKEAELGRALTTDEFLEHHYVAPDAPTASGTSIFDPVLCELAYRWFSPPGGVVLDPFAGGSVRGIVASRLGREYVGVDLSARQIEANREQAKAICGDRQPVWHVSDALDLDRVIGEGEADFVFSCPPYADLEVYSDDPRDLSRMDYEKFRQTYAEIIRKAVAALKDDAFACFVVGDVRDSKGFYYGFPWHTIQAFEDAGARLYNEAVLVTAVGSLPIRAGRQFEISRKLGKTHQNILIFCKGDPKKATQKIGPVEFGDPWEAAAETDAEVVDRLTQGEAEPVEGTDDPAALTPVQKAGDLWLKRDDLFEIAGVPGGKVRTCWALAQGAPGLVTAGSRASPQVNIVAHIGRHLGIPVRAHTPQGELSPEVQAAQDAGAEIVQHKAGYNNVIIKRARDDAAAQGFREIPFGMDCEEAVTQTRRQVQNIPLTVTRLVVPVGSGMSLAGILRGLKDRGMENVPVLGVIVGADPTKRIDAYAPRGWRDQVELVDAGVDYHDAVEANVGGVVLDPHYEAKCAGLLASGDCLWVVGIRQTGRPAGA